MTLVFHYKAPRRQAHLEALEDVVQRSLRPLPKNARLHFRADSAATDYSIWCRYFAAPHRLLLTPAAPGDTVFWLRSESGGSLATFSEEPASLYFTTYTQP